MYAPLQQPWLQSSVVISNQVEQHLQALMLFLILFALLGWTYAWIAVGLSYIYRPTRFYRLTIAPSYMVWQEGDQIVSVYPSYVERGFCWVSCRLLDKRVTLWRWQFSIFHWRRLCAIASSWH